MNLSKIQITENKKKGSKFSVFKKGKEDTSFDLGFYFTTKKGAKDLLSINKAALEENGIQDEYDIRTFRYILNFKNPQTKSFKKYFESNPTKSFKHYREDVNEAIQNGYDSLIATNVIDWSNENQYIAFEPEQIHELGTKQDVEGFKEFVSTQPSTQNQTIGLSTYTNHSGGADGSDTEWDVIGKEFGMVENNHYYTGVRSPKNAPLGNVDITDKPIAREGASKVAEAAKEMWGYKYKTMKDQRLIRNWAQVANSDAVFAIGVLGKPGDIWKGDEKSDEPRKLLKFAVQGGTGYAVEMAIQAGKPVFVFDQSRNQWYKNVDGEWSKTETPSLTKNFAGIGTREINEAGKQAIRDVYTNTLQKTQPTEITKGQEIQPGLELFKDALTEQEQKEFYEFGKAILEKHGYNPFPQYVMASAGQFEWSPELVADKTGKQFNRGKNYNKNIISQKAIVKGSDGTGRWGYHYYPTNLDGSGITPIPQNIKDILQKITGQDMSDYDTVLINLYPSGRTLGWHTDVTEDHRTLDRDIVSVSIGANADFTFANTPANWISGDPSTNYKLGKINLNSGDIISFGGPSRLISHTVTNVTGKTDLGPIDLSDSNVNAGFKGGLLLNDDWRLNFTFRVADANNNNGKRSASQKDATVSSIPTEEITNFYNALTEEQKNILGNLDGLIAAYEDVPFNQPIEDYIEMLKCKL